MLLEIMSLLITLLGVIVAIVTLMVGNQENRNLRYAIGGFCLFLAFLFGLIALFSFAGGESSNTQIVPIEQATASPSPSLDSIDGINIFEGSVLGVAETKMRLTLSEDQIIMGTADKYQDAIDQDLPPFAVFLISGPVDENINLPWGGWDQFRNATSDFIESELAKKVQQTKDNHPTDWMTRGINVYRCRGSILDCTVTAVVSADPKEDGTNVFEGSVPGVAETKMRLTLSEDQIIMGTADKYQDVIDQDLPPFAVFLISGPVDENINLPWGGWDQFRNATSDFIESELAKKVQQTKDNHPTDWMTRGINVYQCRGSILDCTVTAVATN